MAVTTMKYIPAATELQIARTIYGLIWATTPYNPHRTGIKQAASGK